MTTVVGCLLLSLTLLLHSSSALVDQTLARGAGGCLVIEAVLSKLVVSDVFPPDNGFLRRIAYAETRAGLNGNESGEGGPWAVTASMLTRTQTANPALSQLKAKLLAASGVLQTTTGGALNWSAVSAQDIARPLHSAITARLYLELIKATSSNAITLPARIDHQAAFWASRYMNAKQNKTTDVFLQRVTELDDKCGEWKHVCAPENDR